MSAFASLAEHYSAIPITRGVWWHGVSLWCLGVYLSVEAIGGDILRLWMSLDRIVTVGGMLDGVILLKKQSRNSVRGAPSAHG